MCCVRTHHFAQLLCYEFNVSRVLKIQLDLVTLCLQHDLKEGAWHSIYLIGRRRIGEGIQHMFAFLCFLIDLLRQ